MARKSASSSKVSTKKSTPAKTIARKPVSSTAVRNSAIPKVAGAKTKTASVIEKVITHDMISVRAFEISCGPNCGSEFDNWVRAERELRGV